MGPQPCSRSCFYSSSLTCTVRRAALCISCTDSLPVKSDIASCRQNSTGQTIHLRTHTVPPDKEDVPGQTRCTVKCVTRLHILHFNLSAGSVINEEPQNITTGINGKNLLCVCPCRPAAAWTWPYGRGYAYDLCPSSALLVPPWMGGCQHVQRHH